MSASRVDDQHVLSEFDDSEPQTLIEQLVQDDPELSHVPRVAFFFLWFSDIQKLRSRAATIPHGMWHTMRRLVLVNTPMYDLSGICKYTNVYTWGIMLTIPTQNRASFPLCEMSFRVS